MWSWRLARIAGIDLKVHASFLLVIVLGAMQWGGFGTRGAIFGAALMLLLFACVTLHEFGHALVARLFSIPVKDITLYPIGGVARLTRRPRTPFQEFLIAIAGPAVNVVLAALISVVGVQFFEWSDLLETMRAPQSEMPNAQTLVAMLISSNVVLALFNMIPALPMDGGRVFRSLLSLVMSADTATKVSAIFARVLAVGFFAVGWFFNPMLCIIGVFVFFGAGQEIAAQKAARMLDGVHVGDAINDYAPRFTPDTTLAEALPAVIGSNYDAFAVEQFGRFVGVITRKDFKAHADAHGPYAYVAGAMRREIPRVQATDSLEVARYKMEEAEVPFVAVLRNDLFLGVVTEFDVLSLVDRLMSATFTAAPRARGVTSESGT
ncbi:MAG: M50 family metallopeptidase [Archangium sp.]